MYSQIAKKDLEESAQIILYLVKNNTQEQYQEIFKNSPLRFTLISTKGKVLYDSMNPNKVFPMENHLSRVEVQEAIKKGSGFDIRTSQTFGEKFAYYSHYTTSKDRLPVLVRLSSSYEEQSAQLTFFRYVQLAFFLLLNLTILFFYKNYLKRDLQKKFEIMKHFLESGDRKSVV